MNENDNKYYCFTKTSFKKAICRAIIIDAVNNNDDIKLNDFQQNNNGDTSIYADPLTEGLLISKTKLMEQESGLKLFPTYSFWRMYTYNAELKPHKDRESCEISVTVNLGNDGTSWPIFMDGIPVYQEPGDMVVYRGSDVLHGREELKGENHAQVFLHYTTKEIRRYDGRSYIGLPSIGVQL